MKPLDVKDTRIRRRAARDFLQSVVGNLCFPGDDCPWASAAVKLIEHVGKDRCVHAAIIGLLWPIGKGRKCPI